MLLKQTQMRELENRDDLLQLVQLFYTRLLADDTINYLFTEVAKIHLETHLPVLVDFWEMVLFQKDTYRKNALQIHVNLHKLSPLSPHHFSTWLQHFNTSVDELFTGEKAFIIKQRALSIATVMQLKTVHG